MEILNQKFDLNIQAYFLQIMDQNLGKAITIYKISNSYYNIYLQNEKKLIYKEKDDTFEINYISFIKYLLNIIRDRVQHIKFYQLHSKYFMQFYPLLLEMKQLKCFQIFAFQFEQSQSDEVDLINDSLT